MYINLVKYNKGKRIYLHNNISSKSMQTFILNDDKTEVTLNLLRHEMDLSPSWTLKLH